MKYDCNETLCVPRPLLEVSDFSRRPDPRSIAQTNQRRKLPVKLANGGPYAQRRANAGRKRFDQFWDGTSSITITDPLGNLQDVGKLFVSSNTTSNSSSGPGLVDTWTEDWVITDWSSFRTTSTGDHPEVTVTHEGTYSNAGDFITSFQLSNPGVPLHRMILTFHYSSGSSAPAPPPRFPKRQLFEVRNTDGGKIVGYKLRESNITGARRDEFWLLFSDYLFPASAGDQAILTPIDAQVLNADGSVLATVSAGEDLMGQATTLAPAGQTVAYSVSTFGQFLLA